MSPEEEKKKIGMEEVGRLCAKESHMFASSIYFSSFRGHLCKTNRALAAAGLWAAGRGGGRGVAGQATQGLHSDCPTPSKGEVKRQ